MIKMQKGFSLIELMIVVAIIGVLAAIAVPQYNNYIARGQISEAMTLLAAAKTAVEEEIVSRNTFARDGTAPLTTDNTCSGTTLNDLYGITVKGMYIECLYVGTGAMDGSAGTPATGVLGAIFKATGVNSELAGQVISFSRDADGVWKCDKDTSGSPAGLTNVAAELLPASCE